MDTRRAGQQLRLIAEVLEVSEANDVAVWLRGGWAMDFFLGEITRDHGDIDWFAWEAGAGKLAAALARSGYEPVPGPPPQQQLDFAKAGLEISVTLLAEDEAGRTCVAGGPWAGTLWPEAMPAAAPGRLADLEASIVSPQGQIEIKRMTPVWVPGMPRRPKDAEDIARLESALSQRGERHA
ncbi:nucleotidyltransferase domain-containing protein [Streptomyces sp. NPDC017524]|uniref:nucleotidyltransferase domain-containing protein n=1 Tax=unclassified Streptomyces TaxID=2593676 RepID=UPI0037B4B565